MDRSEETAASIEAIRLFLASRGAVFSSPASPEAIAETEARLGLRLPDALRQLYLAFDGTKEETEWHFRFWSLAEIYAKDFGPRRFGETTTRRALHLFFCDMLVYAPVFAVCVDPLMADDTVVWSLFDGLHWKCCASIERFLALLPTHLDQAFDCEHEW
jgi:hypothetical protein